MYGPVRTVVWEDGGANNPASYPIGHFFPNPLPSSDAWTGNPQVEGREAEAFEMLPNPVVLLGVAEAQRGQERWSDAAASLQRYLEERPDAPDRALVERQLSMLQQVPAVLVVQSDPPGAVVYLDGNDSGALTPSRLEVRAGSHTVRLLAADGTGAEQSVDLKLGEERELTFALKPVSAESDAGAGEGGAGAVSAGATGVGRTVRGAAWVALGVGAAGLVTGGVLGGLALREKREYDDGPTETTAERCERMAVFADVGFGVAVAGALTAVVLFMQRRGEPTRDTSAALQFSPAVSPRAAGVRAFLRF